MPAPGPLARRARSSSRAPTATPGMPRTRGGVLWPVACEGRAACARAGNRVTGAWLPPGQICLAWQRPGQFAAGQVHGGPARG